MSRSCGENKIQEATAKRAALSDLAVGWSIVGHLQTKKVKYLTRFASKFHALDSLRLADLLNRRLEREDRFLDVYVQVNTSSGLCRKLFVPEFQVLGWQSQ